MATNSLLHRLRRVGRDDLDRFEQRQTRLDAADDDVDGVRQRLRGTSSRAASSESPGSSAAGRSCGKAKAGRARQAATAHERRPRRQQRQARRKSIQNFCLVQPRPACVIRVPSGTPGSLARRASTSFSDPSTCSRRVRWFLASARRTAGSGFATDARRASRLLLSGQHRIDEYPCHAADRGSGEKGQCEHLQVHGSPPQVSTLTSAASSAAASRFSSP